VATPIPGNRAALDARSVAAATGGVLLRAGDGRVTRGVTTDSRAVTPGCAFVALRGERVDGHAFVDAAIGAGAALVVVEPGRAPSDARAAVVEVGDTLAAWGAIAREHLRAWRRASPDARLVAITGSAGKTTTKELCAALLRTAGETLATTGNLNNRIGVPAVLLQLEPRHRFAVIEVGMSVPGEIADLASLLEPDVGVVVNVGLAHAGGVGGSVDDVAREKGALFAAVREGGTCVANADDRAVMGQLDRAPGRRRARFGREPGAEVRLVSREPAGLEGSRIAVQRAGRPTTFTLPIPGDAAAVDFVAALAAAEAAAGELDDGRVTAALRAVEPMAGRMQVRRAGGVTVLDDAYNANPASMRAAIATLGETREGRRVAVLGEMKELGPSAAHEHETLGEALATAGVALLISCGGLADATARAAKSRGVDVVLAGSAQEAARVAIDRLRPGDVVLVKGSRSVGAERVVEALLGGAGREGR
jgi:UDP-N-acetylmuramoyl-tripeptide--D-alanyl-D-alanine ligase